jgi:hypothetical protein
MFKKLQQKIINWIFEKETITIGEFYKRYYPEKCNIINPDTNELKFIEQAIMDNIYVESESNTFIKADRILKTVEYENWRIETQNGLWLEGADDHIIIKENYDECHIDNLKIGDKIRTRFGVDIITNIVNTNIKENMYDLELTDNSNHLFYTNDILSHNTTTTAAFILMYIMFNEDKKVAMVANKQTSSKEILDRIKLMYDYLPMWLKPGIKVWNKYSIEFENGCMIIASATSASSIRGQSIALLYIDEFAFIEQHLVEEFIESTFPVIASSKLARIIISSTPKGKNHFYRFYKNAMDGKSVFKPTSIEWYEVPGRDMAWRTEKIMELGSQETFDQEYGGEFIDVSNLLISSSILKWFEDTMIKPYLDTKIYDPITKLWYGKASHEYYDIANKKEEDDVHQLYKGFLLWEKPNPQKSYVIVVDVSEGKQQDHSAFIVVDVSAKPFRIVATYQNNEISTIEYPEVIVYCGRYYNDAYLLIENNSIGAGVANDVSTDYEYENTINLDYESEAKVKKKKYHEIGVKTNKRVKKMGALNMKHMIENHEIEFYDERIMDELNNFIRHQTKGFCANSGWHDDLIMCILLFCYLAKIRNYFEGLQQNIKKTAEKEKDDELTGGYAYVEGSKSHFNPKKKAEEESDKMLYRLLMS